MASKGFRRSQAGDREGCGMWVGFSAA